MIAEVRIQPWNLVFLVGFTAYIAIRAIFQRRAQRHAKAVSRVGASEATLLLIVGVGSLLLPVVYLCTSWLAFADYRLPAFAPWGGLVVMAAALLLFWRSHADLGPNWSATLQLRHEHQLITRGVYRVIRHPMYLSIWLFGLAQALLLPNWFAGWAAFVTFAVMYFIRTPREEQMMCEFFGQDYREYMQRTGRLIPRLRRNGASGHDFS